MRARGRFSSESVLDDEFGELTKHSTRGVLVLYLTRLHMDKKPTWSVRGLVMRLTDFQERGQCEGK